MSSLKSSASGKHVWKFFRAGDLDQARLEQGSDLIHLEELDQKLWVALSCPTRGLEFDPRTLDLIDTEKEGRIRAPELIAAVKWATLLLKDPSDLLRGHSSLPLTAINDQNESGAKLLASCREILKHLGKPDATSISVADLADIGKILAQSPFNGDGIVPTPTALDDAVKQVIEEIIATMGPVADRSGKPGVNKEKTDLFYAQIKAFADWHSAGEKTAGVFPLGENTAAAFEALKSVRIKVEDYFTRCRITAFDARARAPLNRAEADFVAFAAKDLTCVSDDVLRLPLARVDSESVLPLNNGLNPAWFDAVAKFRSATVKPLLGERDAISEAEWKEITGKFVNYETWLGTKPVTTVEKLGLPRIQAILASTAKDAIANLIAEDIKLEGQSVQIISVEKLVRYYRDMHVLLRNYVNFADFYDPEVPAIFEAGRLFIDARECELCVTVEDIGKHSTLAATSGIYLAYCELTRPAAGLKRTICAAFTAGFAESLWVGRNGIFYDRMGADWDAVIVKIVEHQISLKEAFWSPWKKIAKMVSDQINKILAAREAAALAAAGKTVEGAAKVAEAPKPPAPAAPAGPGSGAAMASSVAAIGIAVGILGSAVGKLLDFVKDATLLNIVLGILSVIGAVSLPSVLIAYFKLRKRDLGPILNACGWAINGRIKLTLKLGRLLTQEAKLPPGAAKHLIDPYADDTSRRNFWLIVLLLLVTVFLWYSGQLDTVLPGSMKSVTVLGSNAPAAPGAGK